MLESRVRRAHSLSLSLSLSSPLANRSGGCARGGFEQKRVAGKRGRGLHRRMMFSMHLVGLGFSSSPHRVRTEPTGLT